MKEKYRHELKYVTDERNLELIYERMKGICSIDKNAGPQGSYHIRSVYFDDYQNSFYYENENGNDLRYKFRIRIYNLSDQYISLEKKSKENGMTLKKSVQMTRSFTETLLTENEKFDIDMVNKDSGVMTEFMIKRASMLLKPVIIVDYERIPLIYSDGNVRITLDKNISGSKDMAHFFDKELLSRPIMKTGEHILEVKYDEYLPSFVRQQLNLGNLRKTSFSKYYLCRRMVK